MLLDILIFGLFTLLGWSFLVSFLRGTSVLTLYTRKNWVYESGLFVTKKRLVFLHLQKLSYASSHTVGINFKVFNFWLFSANFERGIFNDFWVSRFFSYVSLCPNRNIWFFRWFWSDFVLRICQSVVFFRCFFEVFFFNIFVVLSVFASEKHNKKKKGSFSVFWRFWDT